jgi:hypothetical protein
MSHFYPHRTSGVFYLSSVAVGKPVISAPSLSVLARAMHRGRPTINSEGTHLVWLVALQGVCIS